ncbi:MAG: Mrp/NBP35 family ATP-binding protein [Dehalococcoidales bacterium]|nr:Mrp/NBP35 family ATP-binding protein [Dehalococcoidales bacterium]
MPTQEQIRASLEAVPVPGTMRSLVKMNLVKQITITDHKVDISLASAALADNAQQWLRERIQDAVKKIGIETVSVNFAGGTPKEINRVKNVIAIMSGKGGVGKSLVAGLSAIALRRHGFEVGILDADITGPSIPKMFGINTGVSGSDTGILPVSSKTGIELMSINLLLPGEEEAVIWRGPLIGRAITQFWEDVLWGNLDYLIVDLPPGTADAPLTVLQTLPVKGIIIVFTPQDLTAMIVKKAVNMARQMAKPILGVVENMSYLYVPEIDKKIEIFGKSRGEEMAHAAGAPLLGQLPIDPALARLCDEGNIENYSSETVAKLGESILKSAKLLSAKT